MLNRNMVSPLMTPRTVQLYAFGESASGELDKMNNIFSKASSKMLPPGTQPPII
jgi:hypothetical protein